MTSNQNPFDDLQAIMKQDGLTAVLDRLANEFLAQTRYHELFEIRKMQVRQQLGLPLLYHDNGDELDEATGKQLEEGLVAACREVGTQLLKAGKIREGWTYMRPVGDRASVAQMLANIDAGDENLDELVEVSFHEGVDVGRGYALILEHYGTCNAITALESVFHQLAKADRQAAAALLVRHVHNELRTSVVADITRQQGREPKESSLHDLVADRDWLFGEHSYHIDTTHLASTVRFARVLEDPDVVELAIDLTEYGQRLSEQFQHPGEEPFAEIYPSHALFFRAVLGREVEATLDYFRERAETIDAFQHGAMPIEVYVDLLARVNRYDDAIDAAISLMPPNVHSVGHAPSLMELAERSGRYDRLLDYCRQRDDLLNFGIALAHSR